MSDKITAYYRHPGNGNYYERAEVAAMLKLGNGYAVDKIMVFDCETAVYLRGFDKPFNSVFFDFVKNEKPYDPVIDSRNWIW